jgi:solute carrier family 25 protein 33/36
MTRTWVTETQFSVAAGGMAGLVSTCMTNPFDVLRSRLAASREATGATSKHMSEHLRLFVKDGVLRGVKAGLGVNLLTSIPTNAIYLSSYRFLSAMSQSALGENSFAPPIVSAFGAVAMTNGTLAPMFTIRTRCQLDSNATGFGIARSIMAKEGVRGFYRGAATNAVGRMVEEATFWFLYENAKKATRQGDMSSSVLLGSLGVIGLSSASKLVGSGISYPYNVVMTHLREVDKVTGHHHHNAIHPTIRFIYAKDGVPGFYKGAVPHLMRCALSKASQVWCFELFMLWGRPLYAPQP